MRVVRLRKWGGLTGNISTALDYCQTPYVLIVQHDMPFTVEIPLGPILRLMEHSPRVRCIRFNRKANEAYGFDATPRSRIRWYRSQVFPDCDERIQLTQTIGWSDNNHLCKKHYYTDIILPLCGRSAYFPEHAANRAASPFLHRLFGTYIYGYKGMEAVVEHIDGREEFEKQRPIKRDAYAQVADRIRLVLRRLVSGVKKVRYRAKAYVLWVSIRKHEL